MIISRHSLIKWCQELKSTTSNVSHKPKKQTKGAEQIMREAITKDVAEATRIVIQTMAEMQTQTVPNAAGTKPGSPTLKQPTFNLGPQTNIQSGKHLF